MIDHIEFILATEQNPEEFKPANDDSFDLQPTKVKYCILSNFVICNQFLLLRNLFISIKIKACIDAVECLSKHTKLVIGCSDKHILDVFFQEIGLRFFG